MLTHANLLWCGISGAAANGLGYARPLLQQQAAFPRQLPGDRALLPDGRGRGGDRRALQRHALHAPADRASHHDLQPVGHAVQDAAEPARRPQGDTAHSVRFAGYAINISAEEIRAFIDRFRIPLRNGYGQSEAMLYITLQSQSSPSTYPSIGRPALDREVFIIDDGNHPRRTG